MAAKTDIDRIAALLTDDADDKRVAAAIVLGELRANQPAVIRGLVTMLESNTPSLSRPALDALVRIGARAALPSIFPLLGSRDAEVRERAVAALASAGELVVPEVRARMESAGPSERRLLESVLAHVGGKEALGAILESFTGATEEEIRAAVIEARHELRDADAKRKRTYYTQINRYLSALQKKKGASEAALAGVVKLLGYLEDSRSIPTLLQIARAPKLGAAVRQEALIALRFALAVPAHAPKVFDALMKAAESDDRTLSQTALIALGELELPKRHLARFARLAAHPDSERARFAVEKLAREGGTAATASLVELLAGAERDRAELAATALRERRDAVGPLCTALVAAKDPDRAWLIGKVLGAHALALSTAQRKKLLDTASVRLSGGKHGWEALVAVARHADPERTAKTLRAIAAKLRAAKKPDRAQAVLADLCSHEGATDEDRLQLILLELNDGQSATPSTRAMALLDTLVRHGFDVAGALRKDRRVSLEDLYALGFRLIERDHPLGEELLAEVVEKAGRKKIGTMAKNKLRLAGYE